MKNTLKRALLYTTAGFIVFFFLRLLYGYLVPQESPSAVQSYYRSTAWESRPIKRKNYASKTLMLQTADTGATAKVDQKYEKIGTLSAKTSDFERDEKQLHTLIQQHNILVQFEQRSGLPKNRILDMALGVVPKKFDQVLEQIKSIGTLLSIQIDKSDKTNEYKELEAKKQSLEKTRSALSALKGQGGPIKELIELENRILEIENQIQGFGVSLGEFDEENEFCTVKFTLLEIAAKKNISFLHRIKVAFEWTVLYYSAVLFILFIGTLTVFLIISSIQKVQWLQRQIYKVSKK
ncbi:MAG: DUF4349 domain-containing protein [Candidatus Electrothrix sp. MAN1_4]|nr:DUF4349 domain-containing protein [Candidatus Electrothrix sp. MAN1_4]